MSKIRSTNSGLDRAMQELLVASHLSFLAYPKLYGHPDFLIGSKIALFCDSSFWHGRNWTKLKKQLEKGNDPEYWTNHISKNRLRDKEVTRVLKNNGFVVVRFWDTDIHKRPEWCINKLVTRLDQVRQQVTGLL